MTRAPISICPEEAETAAIEAAVSVLIRLLAVQTARDEARSQPSEERPDAAEEV